ncbi:hypothetical protein KGA66_15625 [Actinocrinis puniceicyclus]|uniref:GH26 domain-containing protein n=1 Tax=Actinocrinis puniceicyclus TaxID=977794 RepID=A0A8J7WR61_9ACTN|nr:glycosyl hydrolase [Actinocrinis puniceicyclus]MBS2964487.1 hypothetical protein [Actinocrinis puniceicyclus]
MIRRRFRLAALLSAFLVVAISLGCVAIAGGSRSSAAQTAVRTATSSPAGHVPAPGSTGPGGASGRPAIPANGRLYFGVSSSVATLPAFESAAGIERPAILGGYIGGTDDVSTVLDDVDDLPSTAPMVSWGVDFTGGKVVSGAWDSYLYRQARAVAAFGRPVFLRLDWEMNATWYGLWGDGYVSPADYVAAWQHVWEVFQDAGAGNAAFVWSPNTGRFSSLAASAWYPGDRYVDWVGIDTYPSADNEATVLAGADGLDVLAAFSQQHDKPVMLAEWAPTAPQPDRRGVFDLVFSWADQHPATVKALVYFNYPTQGRDHLLVDFPVGASALRSLVKQHGGRLLYTVGAARAAGGTNG